MPPVFYSATPTAMKRYGLGLARPAPVNNDALVAAGYLHKADTLAGAGATAWSGCPNPERDGSPLQPRRLRRAWIGNLLKAATAITGRWAIRAISLTPVMPPAQRAVRMPSNFIPAIWDLTGPGHHRRCPGRQYPRKPHPGAVRGGKRHGFADGRHLSGPGITLGPGLTFGDLAACHLAQHSTH